MCIFKIGPYIISIVRMSKSNCKKHYVLQTSYVWDLYKKNIITENERDHALSFLNKWKIDCSHSFAYIKKYDTFTNAVIEFYFGITKSENDVTIVKPLSNHFLGEKDQKYQVIKITDNLYITSHSLIPNINLTELKLQELHYDSLKNYYFDIDASNSNNPKITEFSNLSSENVEKMVKIIIQHIESTEIKKVDISNAENLVNDVAALIYFKEFQKNRFDKATYEEIGAEMSQIDDEVMQIQRGLFEEL